jgi:PadR family transcriptional regulator PadR
MRSLNVLAFGFSSSWRITANSEVATIDRKNNCRIMRVPTFGRHRKFLSCIRTRPHDGSILTFDIETQYHTSMSKPTEILQGTLDLLVLRTLELAPLHGVGISDRIEQVTRGVFVVGPGSLFPALHRLAKKGWIEGEWCELESKRRVKAYRLTSSGRAQLSREKGIWKRVLTAVNQVLAEES